MFILANCRIYTVKNGIIENGSIFVKHGKIDKVGIIDSYPDGIPVYDLKGKSVTPGFIDAHCHVGIFNEGTGNIGSDGNDVSSPTTPFLKSVDGIYPDDEAFDDALENGVTTMCIGPGSANVIGGQMAVVKPISNIIDEMVLTDYVGLKCAFGENPKGVYGERNIMPTTRMGVAGVLRKALYEAKNYLLKKEFYEKKISDDGKPQEPFYPEIDKEILIPILKKEKPLRCHAHRMDDIQTAIRIAEEFDVDIVIEHCTEGYKIADFLASKGIKCIIGPLNGTKPKVELKDSTLKAPMILEKAGVDFAVMTDAPVERIGALFDDVRLFVRHGLTEKTALESITINPAQILGFDDQFGSIENGKVADLNIFSGDPFDFRSKIETVIIYGKIEFGDLENE